MKKKLNLKVKHYNERFLVGLMMCPTPTLLCQTSSLVPTIVFTSYPPPPPGVGEVVTVPHYDNVFVRAAYFMEFRHINCYKVKIVLLQNMLISSVYVEK